MEPFTADPLKITDHGTLKWDIEKLAGALVLSVEDTKAYFRDGRRVSFVIERRLCFEVIEGTMAASEGAGYDLIDPDGDKWEVRSISSGGIYFCPSYMVGSGRKFNEPGFLTKLREVEGYLVSDISKFPEVPFWKIPSQLVEHWYQTGQLGAGTTISRNKALSLIAAASR